jgi:putative oxidoreductase
LKWKSNKAMTTWGYTVLRLVVGTVFFLHGWQKLTMMSFDGVAGFFGAIGIPMAGVAAVVVTLVELVGGLALIAVFLTRWISIPLATTMAVAILTVHLPTGFFVTENGMELALSQLAGAFFFLLAGPGAYSVGALLFEGRRSGNVQVRQSSAGAAA